MRARPAPTAVPLVKKKIRRRCYTCPGCISSPCGTCSQCVSTAKKRSTCKLQACWKLNHNLEGGVGSDGFVDYCIKCGPEYESPSEGEEGGGEEEGEEENKVQVVGGELKQHPPSAQGACSSPLCLCSRVCVPAFNPAMRPLSRLGGAWQRHGVLRNVPPRVALPLHLQPRAPVRGRGR